MTDPLAFFAGGGEAGRMIRGRDRSNHPLGQPRGWPMNLNTLIITSGGNVDSGVFGLALARNDESRGRLNLDSAQLMLSCGFSQVSILSS